MINVHVFLTPAGQPIQAFSREGTIDWNTLQSCIVEDEYRVKKLPDGDGGVAIDLGGYIGGCSLALAAKGYSVFMVEPLPENVAVARRSIAVNRFDAPITIIEAAITTSPHPEIAVYYASPDTPLGKEHEFIGAVVPRLTPGISDGASRFVPTMSLDELFTANRISRCNFLKVDVEGSEWDIFRNTSTATLGRIDRIAIEIDSPEPTTTNKFLQLLQGKFVDASEEYFPQWAAPGKSLHGYFINKQL